MSEVVGRRMPIKKHGREFQGLCPFHGEKTPSFTVNDEKNFFHCFGCGAHGDAIEFVRRYDRLSYPEAIESLARDAGIPLPVASEAETRKAATEKTLYDVMEAAAQWYERQLQAASGTVAMDYVRTRGLNSETLRMYRVGYAPEERTALHTHLTKAGFAKPLQAEAGLIIIPEDGPAYDRFRGRLMFPIRNASGKVIAFGGRLLGSNKNKALPKYLNSPETPLFKKGEVLFNLDLAKRTAREGGVAVVMEGYMDVVSSVQGGIPYAVATLGTAITPEHLRLLWQNVKEPILCLDGDAAGMRAMMRAAEVALPMLKPGYSLRFATLPKGEDPDTYIQKFGKASFEKVLASSRRLSQVIWDTTHPQFNTRSPEDRAALEDALRQTTDKIGDQTVRAHYSSYFRKLLWEKPEAPARQQQQQQPMRPASGKPSLGKPTASAKAPARVPVVRAAQVEHMMQQQHSSALDTLVQRLLNVVLKYPAFLQRSQVEETLSRMDIPSPRLDSLRNTIVSAAHVVPLEESAGFCEYVQSQLPGLPLESVMLSYLDNLTPDDARYLWTETISAYQVMHLKVEAKALEESLASSMNEEVLQRLTEVKSQLHQAEAGMRFAPAESEIQ